jgi:hypothetical protein
MKFSRDLFGSVKDRGIAFFLLMEGTQCGVFLWRKACHIRSYPHGIKKSISDLDMEGFWPSDKSRIIAVTDIFSCLNPNQNFSMLEK